MILLHFRSFNKKNYTHININNLYQNIRNTYLLLYIQHSLYLEAHLLHSDEPQYISRYISLRHVLRCTCLSDLIPLTRFNCNVRSHDTKPTQVTFGAHH